VVGGRGPFRRAEKIKVEERGVLQDAVRQNKTKKHEKGGGGTGGVRFEPKKQPSETTEHILK